MQFLQVLTTLAWVVSGITAREIPSNLRTFYDRIKDGKCVDGYAVQSGFQSTLDGPKSKTFIRMTDLALT